MLMNTLHTGPIPVLRYFYVMNFVVFLLIMVLGGTLVISRLQRHPFHPWDGSSSARKILIVGLGLLWILDGLLQAQPLMVTQFIHELVEPLLAGQPGAVAGLMRTGIHLWSLHPLAWDVAAIWIQILLGLLILFGEDAGLRRVALWASIGWGLIVWVGGEGLGSLLSGGSWFIGSPGSVVLYVVAAVALLLSPTRWSAPAFRDAIRKFVAGLWLLFGVLQAWPGQGWWSTKKLGTDILTQAQMSQPRFISAPLYELAHRATIDPGLWNGIFVTGFCLLALIWGVWRPTRLTWWVTVVATFAIWWLGQDLGVFGGMGTDPNSGAILLLGLIVYADLEFSRPKSEPSPLHSGQRDLSTSA